MVADCYSNDKLEALILQNEKFEEEEEQYNRDLSGTGSDLGLDEK